MQLFKFTAFQISYLKRCIFDRYTFSHEPAFSKIKNIMRNIFLLSIISYLVFACTSKQPSTKNTEKRSASISLPIVVEEENNSPSVDISHYTLINDGNNDRSKDAKEILKIKRKWPLAMQSLNPLAFDSILSKNFTFKGIDDFYDRAAYIQNRTKPDDWKIIFVQYENLTLQFFGNTGVLSYVNHITNRNNKTSETEYEHISWVDVYELEDGQWKIASSHAIDYRLEVPEK